jgi:hypothetical protein
MRKVSRDIAEQRCRDSVGGFVPVMRTHSTEGNTDMTNDEIAEILAKRYAQQLLTGPEPARMA